MCRNKHGMLSKAYNLQSGQAGMVVADLRLRVEGKKILSSPNPIKMPCFSSKKIAILVDRMRSISKSNACVAS